MAKFRYGPVESVSTSHDIGNSAGLLQVQYSSTGNHYLGLTEMPDEARLSSVSDLSYKLHWTVIKVTR